MRVFSKALPGNVVTDDARFVGDHLSEREIFMTELPERESMEFDVVIVGAGPAGLAAAIRITQPAAVSGQDISVLVLEKALSVGKPERAKA